MAYKVGDFVRAPPDRLGPGRVYRVRGVDPDGVPLIGNLPYRLEGAIPASPGDWAKQKMEDNTDSQRCALREALDELGGAEYDDQRDEACEAWLTFRGFQVFRDNR